MSADFAAEILKLRTILIAVQWSATVDCPECADGFQDHPGCPICKMPRHMGHGLAVRGCIA